MTRRRLQNGRFDVEHGESHLTMTPEYRAWKSMMARCYTPSAKGFENYGGRGIRVADQWHSYDCFVAEAGRRPSVFHSLDRIKNDLNYEPGNVRWATRLEQNNNKRNVLLIEFNGERHSMAEWSRILGIGRATLRYRLLGMKWTPEKAFTTPLISPSDAGRMANTRNRS